MMKMRTFGVKIVDEKRIIYDPCSGLIYAFSDMSTRTGRVTLNESELSAGAIIHPNHLKSLFPVSICWSPIVACNLNCCYCLDDKSIQAAGGDRLKLAHLIGQSGIWGVDISGGEPLLIPDVADIAAALTSRGLVVSITTNGWFLAEKIAVLKKAVDAVRVSLDGWNAEKHDCWRGKGSFEWAITGIRAAVNNEIPVQIQVVVMNSNLAALPEFLELAVKEGVYGITLLQMLPIGEGRHFALENMVSDDLLEREIKKLTIPDGFCLRWRRRETAGGFMVVRSDGYIYRNAPHVTSIECWKKLERPEDLRIDDGLYGAIAAGS